jgi:hypothetical protein
MKLLSSIKSVDLFGKILTQEGGLQTLHLLGSREGLGALTLLVRILFDSIQKYSRD